MPPGHCAELFFNTLCKVERETLVKIMNHNSTHLVNTVIILASAGDGRLASVESFDSPFSTSKVRLPLSDNMPKNMTHLVERGACNPFPPASSVSSLSVYSSLTIMLAAPTPADSIIPAKTYITIMRPPPLRYRGHVHAAASRANPPLIFIPLGQLKLIMVCHGFPQMHPSSFLRPAPRRWVTFHPPSANSDDDFALSSLNVRRRSCSGE